MTIAARSAAAVLALALGALAPGLAAATPQPTDSAAILAASEAGGGVFLARRGADDRPGHDRGDDRGRRGRGRDDRPGHAVVAPAAPAMTIARHGADDRPGDDRGGKGRGRGRDDGPNHA